MPILNPGASEDLADDEMPTLNEEDAGDYDAPPELSPMPVKFLIGFIYYIFMLFRT
jgi:hypothetical protein